MNSALSSIFSSVWDFQLVLVFLITLLSAYLVVRWFRRRNLPPGPTGLPLLGYLPFLGDKPYKTLLKLGDKYGDIFGLYMGRRYTVILNTYDLTKEVITHPASLYRAPIFSIIPEIGAFDKGGREWTEQRSYCFKTAKDLGLGKGPWTTIIATEAKAFSDTLAEHRGQPVEASQLLSTSLVKNVVYLLTGRGLKAETFRLVKRYADFVFSGTGPIEIGSIFPSLVKFLAALRLAGFDKMIGVFQTFSKYLRNEVRLHKSDPEISETEDFINTYLNKMKGLEASKNTDHYFSENNLVGSINALFLAGTDTIHSSLEWIFRFLATRSDIQKKVCKELTDVFGKDGIATYEERHKIPYTFAVLMEAQRCSSIVPLGPTRTLNEDIVIKGYTIPKGTDIVSNFWALHNDPKYWDQPEKFIPERFLENDGKSIVKSRESYVPFSIGKRNCPGEHIAWMEILAYFAEVIRRFRISLAPGVNPDFTPIMGLVYHLKPQELCFKERDE